MDLVFIRVDTSKASPEDRVKMESLLDLYGYCGYSVGDRGELSAAVPSNFLDIAEIPRGCTVSFQP